MAIFFVVKIVANNDDAFVVAELRGGHGGREFVGVGFFPRDGVFTHFLDNFSELGVIKTNLSGFLAQARIRGGDNFHNIIYDNTERGKREG